MKISAKINNIVFYNEENSFAIMNVITNGGETVSVKGIFPDMALAGSFGKSKDIHCTIEGEWFNHHKYGKGINASSIKIADQSGLLFFLTNIVKGLGGGLAKQLIDTYGEDKLIEIIENNPNKLLKIKGIKARKLKKIINSWNEYKELKNITKFFVEKHVELSSYLLFTIYKHFKNKNKDFIQSVSENPYCLTDVKGIGFKTADKIALQLGVNRFGVERAKALVDYVLLSQAADNGHTFLYKSDLTTKCIECIEKGEKQESEVSEGLKISVAIESVLFSGEYYIDSDERISLKGYKMQEDYLGNFFKIRSSEKSLYVFDKVKTEGFIQSKEKELGIKFSDKQVEAINAIAKGSSIFALCGYAGSGKTTISKVILDFYKEFVGKESIITCAFTGMASKRITDLTGYNASTIHSLLGFNATNGGFKHDKEDPLPYEVIMVDEASMVNLKLFYSLVRALKKDTVLILIGDDAQLPPIGEGNVFGDILKKDYIPSVKLDKIYRQSEKSVLTYFASFIRNGEMPPDIEGEYTDFKYINMDIPNYYKLKNSLPENELKQIKEDFYKKLRDELINEINMLDITGVNKIWNVQIVTPMKNTDLGTESLNKILQDVLNNGYKQNALIKGFQLRQYDKVIHLKNQNMFSLDEEQYKILKNKQDDFDLSDIADTTTKRRIYNGSLGLVLDIDRENELFSVVYPDPEKRVVVVYSFNDYKNLIDLGYALTVHKTQGGQFDYVFMPIINAFYIMLNNKLFYTAVTRAKKRVTIIGQSGAVKRASTNIDSSVRNTFLKDDTLNKNLY